MDIQVQHMPTEGDPVEAIITDATFDKVRKFIGARNAEFVRVDGLTDIMLVDEEGLLEGKKINACATFLAGRPIVGDAVIVDVDDLDAIPYGTGDLDA